MKLLLPACAAVIAALLSASCTTYTYDEQPEGYVTQSVPIGYTALMIGGISYWHHHSHYYRYWPNYGYVVVRPPHGRPPYTRPPGNPNRPGKPGNPGHPGKPVKPGKPSHPIAKPNLPSNNRPSTQPVTRPVTRPSTPSYKRPATRPAARPAARPSGRSRR